MYSVTGRCSVSQCNILFSCYDTSIMESPLDETLVVVVCNMSSYAFIVERLLVWVVMHVIHDVCT